ncbi:PIN domain-containing protein [Kribbia dieselivorans]|uniref:PIN domain-containing protein n=1 Tax=Kribbia dieselivorans TaxID=331526 RepID=UPI0008382A4A|nr:type II toxin-antitoxin system VapC family toxin [Kribbia dieselivorans]
MTGLDTNVLIRFLVRDDEVQFAAAAEVMASLTPAEPGFITQVTLVELYWVLARGYQYPREACLAAIGQLVTTASLEFDDGEGVVRALTLAEDGADFPDALIQSAMELFAIGTTVTFDRRAARSLGWRLLGDS